MTNWTTKYDSYSKLTFIYYNDNPVGELTLPDKVAYMDLKRRLR